ncbi:MAG: site-2 protease family protein [Sedimentisphaerales bacterium]|nr:site-2 protease family protein [Sedimentisphaerales bacterium]
MSKSKDLLKKYSGFIVIAGVVAGMAWLLSSRFYTFWNIFILVMGFSAIVFVHELGHFVVAKLSNIKVETFSIFLPPVFLGVRRTEKGIRFRILPKFFPKKGDESGDGLLSFTIGKGRGAGETEYRIGLVPVAAYVKMLGQEDVGADKNTNDPRSYSNKPVSVRMAVVSAGVIFNVIAAVVLLMAVYLVGIKQAPAVVGAVVPGSPAEAAGLCAGDEIVEVAGKSSNLYFGDVMMAAALSDRDELVPLKVRHEDGTVEDFKISAEQLPDLPLRGFGISLPSSLTVADISSQGAFAERTGLQSQDEIVSVDGIEVETYWHFESIVRQIFKPGIKVLAKRTDEVSGQTKLVEGQIPLSLGFQKNDAGTDTAYGHICSMVPRLRVVNVSEKRISTTAEDSLQAGDVIVAIGDVENPTYSEMRQETSAFEGRKLPVRVLRVDEKGNERQHQINVEPYRPKGSERVLIGIAVGLDAEHPVVADTVSAEEWAVPLTIPRGALITAVDGVKVSNFYDIIREIRSRTDKKVAIDYRLDDKTSGGAEADLSNKEKIISLESKFAGVIVFEPLEHLYKADGVLDALVMSSKRSVWFVVKTYVTLKGLAARTVNPKALSGPVGIISITYQVVKHSFISFLYLLAFISANLAVINFLPIPVLDGGAFVLLIAEKIKGRALSIRVQEAISYIGLTIIAAIFLYLTYNDIFRGS